MYAIRSYYALFQGGTWKQAASGAQVGADMDKVYVERKHGRMKVTYKHPDLEPILQDTYGVILYQEQVMQIASKMGGFTMGEADT